MSSIYKILQESFQGIRVVKAFTAEPYERRRFREATRTTTSKSMLVVNIDALAEPDHRGARRGRRRRWRCWPGRTWC